MAAADQAFVAVEHCIKGAEWPCAPTPDHRGKIRYRERLAWWTVYDGDAKVVFGHYKFPWNGRRANLTPTEPGWIAPHYKSACLDFGAHAGKSISLLRWPEDEFITFDCLPEDLDGPGE
jgi:hypothetical protein